MKGRAVLFAMSAFFLIFSSCRKQDNYYYGSVSATINGAAFKSTTVAQANMSPDSGEHFYQFAAVDSAGTLDFDLPTLTIGAYYFGVTAGSPNISYYTGNNYYTTISPVGAPTTGAIIIDSTSKNSITGTFNGVLYNQNLASDSVLITNGIFTNCQY